MVSMAEEVKYILYLTIGFLNDTFFFNQVLLSRILSGLAIYLQNDLNFSENVSCADYTVSITEMCTYSTVSILQYCICICMYVYLWAVA